MALAKKSASSKAARRQLAKVTSDARKEAAKASLFTDDSGPEPHEQQATATTDARASTSVPQAASVVHDEHTGASRSAHQVAADLKRKAKNARWELAKIKSNANDSDGWEALERLLADATFAVADSSHAEAAAASFATNANQSASSSQQASFDILDPLPRGAHVHLNLPDGHIHVDYHDSYATVLANKQLGPERHVYSVQVDGATALGWFDRGDLDEHNGSEFESGDIKFLLHDDDDKPTPQYSPPDPLFFRKDGSLVAALALGTRVTINTQYPGESDTVSGFRMDIIGVGLDEPKYYTFNMGLHTEDGLRRDQLLVLGCAHDDDLLRNTVSKTKAFQDQRSPRMEALAFSLYPHEYDEAIDKWYNEEEETEPDSEGEDNPEPDSEEEDNPEPDSEMEDNPEVDTEEVYAPYMKRGPYSDGAIPYAPYFTLYG
jgi:hypothetical protein